MSGGPVFHLRGVDFTKLKIKYDSGFYENYRARKSSISILNTTVFTPQHTSNVNDGTYTFKDRNNSIIVVASSNYKNFTEFKTTRSKGECQRCRKSLGTKDEPVGIPIAMNVEWIPEKGRFVKFYTEGEYCSYKCALGQAMDNLSLPCYGRDILYNNSVSWLKSMYKLRYPDVKEELSQSGDPRLLTVNGGSLSEKEFHDGDFYRTTLFVSTPVKINYIKLH